MQDFVYTGDAAQLAIQARFLDAKVRRSGSRLVTVTLAKGANLLLQDEARGWRRCGSGSAGATSRGSSAIELDGLISVSASPPGGGLVLANQVPNPEESVTAHAGQGPIVGDAGKLVVTLGGDSGGVSRLLFGLTIYDASQRRQTFRSVRGAYIRVLNHANGVELARYTLEPGDRVARRRWSSGSCTATPSGWKFRAVGQGYADGLAGLGRLRAAPAAVSRRFARPVERSEPSPRASATRDRRSVTDHLRPPLPRRPSRCSVSRQDRSASASAPFGTRAPRVPV